MRGGKSVQSSGKLGEIVWLRPIYTELKPCMLEFNEYHLCESLNPPYLVESAVCLGFTTYPKLKGCDPHNDRF